MSTIRSNPGFLARIFNDPRYQRLHTPKARKVASIAQVVATGLVTLGYYIAFDIDSTGPSMSGFLVLLPAFLFWVYATGHLNASLHGITEIPDADLDEFQRAIRDVAHRKAWRIATWVLVVAFFVAQVIPDLASAVVLGGLLLLIGLPVHVLAWSFPAEVGAEAT